MTVPGFGAQPVLTGHHLIKRYGQTHALAGVDISIAPGEVVAIIGPSGSGKSTLLHVLAGILPVDDGVVMLDGKRIDQFGETERSKLRRSAFGFVFQAGMLVGELTAEENAALPMLLAGMAKDQALTAARQWLTRLGLAGMEGRRPGELSGGQAQRVAIARALAHRPRVIFADEPTGALDSRTSDETIGALLAAAKESGAAVVIVTHDPQVAARAERVVEIRDGLIARRVAA
ncbi:ABC transporter ATP-binding protein [Crossiella cryophila]|uniref:Putative ABC transport system ATP-binding protein n=1 Tax=Crossiella cryophila TaxID=43355 RepID=A0A7W7C7P2_9PSEU|nr:ABC transporter ATP-binding protein [Crossiella cryophila]MBB4676064.1 putative ABC transport system ATP-binding protein [Crossiella cryophila]